MGRDLLEAKCKKCRRAREKLFLKGDRCDSPKCAIVRRPYAPGAHGKNVSKGLSEFGRQLAMKQKIKRIYGVMERQFRNHFEEVSGKKGVTGDLLMERLEMRLDNVVRRAGFALSPIQARQLVNHNFFSVNGKKVDIPSFQVKIGDVITLRESKREKGYTKERWQVLKNMKNFPSWIQVNAETLTATIVARPNRADLGINVDPQMIVEYYSK